MKILLPVFIVMMLSGCAFVPKKASHQPYADNCQMTTKKMTLDNPKATQTIGCQKTMHGGQFLSCLVVSGIIVPAGSFIFSGSVVLINNTLHWLEYQGRCDKKQLEKESKITQSSEKAAQ